MNNKPIMTPNTPNKFKKIALTILITIAAVVIGIAQMVLLLRLLSPELFDSLYYGNIYSGNRNIGTITVNVDGQPYTLTADNFSQNDYEEIGFHNTDFAALTMQEDGSAKVEIANAEKKYCGYVVTVDGMEYPIIVIFGHNPWWSVVKYDLTVNVDTTTDTVSVEGVCIENGDEETINKTATNETYGDDTFAYLRINSLA